jgi:drug/metabolite transporter (DMT)-like permease
MNWYIYAILASISWGIGQVFIKKGLKNMSPLFSNILAGVFAILIEVPFALWGGVQWKFFPQIFLFAIFANLPNFIFPYVISKTDVSVGGTLLATYPIYTIILSLLFLHESLDGMQIMAIVAVVVGMYLVLKSDSKKIKLSEGVLWALIGAVLVGSLGMIKSRSRRQPRSQPQRFQRTNRVTCLVLAIQKIFHISSVAGRIPLTA